MTIADQNDAFRMRLGLGGPIPGRTVMTTAVAALPADQAARILQQVRAFNRFTKDNDPYGEHDMGFMDVDGERVIWKIDYYADSTMQFGAENPAQSYRVLTIMLGSDY